MDNSAISIHSLRVEGDTMRSSARGIKSISIHSLRVEGDAAIYSKQKIRRYFNPLPPCGGRHIKRWALTEGEDISIHSLRVEGDPSYVASLSLNLPISIHSLRVEGDWQPPGYDTLTAAISIHSLRVEGDEATRKRGGRERHFNPLPPCGGRQKQSTPKQKRRAFQSTPSVWRETAPVIHVTCQCRDFNPRPPCGGRRHGSQGRDGRLYTFQSTPSVWRETGHGQQDCRPYPISIHSLRVEGDRRILTMQEEGAISIHSLRVEGDR